MRKYKNRKTEIDNPNVKKDCFAFNSRNCRALTEMMCKNGRCSFYKTRRQFEDDLKKYPPLEM